MASSDGASTQTEAPVQVPPCPVCHQTDQVRDVQTAFDLGIERLAPPPMPRSTARMMPWIVVGFLVYLSANFYLLVQLAGPAGFSAWPLPLQILEVAAILLSVLVALALSFIAFPRVMRRDQEVARRYSAWERAMNNWHQLYYCLRDNVVFDSDQRIISDAQLRSLLATDQAPLERG